MSQVAKRLLAYSRLMRFDRPTGGWLLLWPALWALWASSQTYPLYQRGPEPKLLVLFIIGAWIMRAAGCIMNDLADREFDGHVARTRMRPLVTGTVSLKEAIILLILLSLIALVLALQLNRFSLKLAVIGFLLAVIYPFMKRFTHWPQLGLGIAFAWSVPMAYAAQLNAIPQIAWLLFAAAVLWPLGYDTLYAMMDTQDDYKLGLKSTALWLGDPVKVKRFVGGVYGIMLALLVRVGLQLARPSFYYMALLIAAGLMSYQLYNIAQHESAAYWRAFKNNTWVGAVIFLGFLWS